MQEIEKACGASRDAGIVGLGGFVQKSPSIDLVPYYIYSLQQRNVGFPGGGGGDLGFHFPVMMR
jgi:hypothetical protein